MTHEEVKKELLKNKKIAAAFRKNDLAYNIGCMVEELRLRNGLSQAALAQKIGTKQTSIARLESGSSLPSLSFLKRIADATETTLVLPQFLILKKETEKQPLLQKLPSF